MGFEMDRETLLKLIEDDDLGLLEVKKQSDTQSADYRLLAAFQEINQYILDTGNEPQCCSKDIREFTLYNRLKHFREDVDKIQSLIKYDEFGLLATKKRIASIEDIFNDDDLGLLNGWSDSIYDIQHISKEINVSDYVAQRKPCLDFEHYEDLFKQCHIDLAHGNRKLWPFAKEQQISKGDFFVLKGILTYIAAVGEKESINGKKNARLRCIFENGTESDMLLRSLARELYRDGRRVTRNLENLLEGFDNISDKDISNGYIYILKSLSGNPAIKTTPNLYKIGFSRISVEERIKYAAKEATYLFGPVQVIATYQCFNFDPQKFELLLHSFFGNACLNIEVFDINGQGHLPREWFIAPLDVINQAITLLIKGEIINYHYNTDRQIILGR